MQPIKDNILVKPMDADAVSAGGIVVPDNVQQRPSKATVMAVGGKVKGIEKGDTVFHVLDAGIEVEWDSHKYYIMKQMDILARIPKTDTS